MNILQQLMEKAWLTPQGVVLAPAVAGRVKISKTKLGLWVFLSVVTVLFLLLLVAYAGRMAFEDWRPGPDIGLLWFNTLALLCSSIAMQWATIAVRRGQIDDAWSGLMTGGLLACVFLAGQVMAWRQLASMGTFSATVPAVTFFYLITVLHALHILGGLVAWGMTTARLLRGDAVVKIQQSIELCTVYWHFMFGVWVVLFGLLFSGNNLSAVLAFCGLR